MPRLSGRPIRVRFLANLRADRGILRSGGSRGEEVHAGSFLRQREIVLDAALLPDSGELARILVHELFHFVWLRAGNSFRRSWESLLEEELRRGARGELGWSASLRKARITPADRNLRTRRWREYACESFCDTAAWLYSGARRHPEFTLPARFRISRRDWFARSVATDGISV
jgi:hypothetical protein